MPHRFTLLLENVKCRRSNQEALYSEVGVSKVTKLQLAFTQKLPPPPESV